MSFIKITRQMNFLPRTTLPVYAGCIRPLKNTLPFNQRSELNQKGYQSNLSIVPASYFSISSVNYERSFSEKVKNELSVFKTVDLSNLKSAPFPAVVYGFGGIVPFVFPPLYFLVGSFSPFLATSQLMYGATILAFVGGVRWGNALAKEDVSHDQIGKSTIPSLVAWSALLVPEPLGFLIVSSGLLGALYVDLTSSKYLPWFYAMRCTLTGIAITSLMTTFVCHLVN